MEKVLDQETYELARTFKWGYLHTETAFRRTRTKVQRDKDKGNEEEDEQGEDGEGIVYCRRFIVDGKGKCRVEYGSCAQPGCGNCFQRSGKWQQGENFISQTVQLQQVCEFFQYTVGRSPEQPRGLFCDVMALGQKPFHDGIPSGTTTTPGPEEKWFGVIEAFPTVRRPVMYKREWDTSFPVGENQEKWLADVGI